MKKIIPAFSIVLIDQLSKYIIKSNYTLFQSQPVIVEYLKFTYIENPGLAFGLSVGSLSWLLFLITLFITIYILRYIVITSELIKYEYIALTFILGGAIGNLIDRGFSLFGLFGYQGVIDFIDIGLFEHSYRWYIFNIADLSVSIGIGCYIFCSYFCSRSDRLEHDFS